MATRKDVSLPSVQAITAANNAATAATAQTVKAPTKRNRRTFPTGPEATYLKAAFLGFVDSPSADSAIRLDSAMKAYASHATGVQPKITLQTMERMAKATVASIDDGDDNGIT